MAGKDFKARITSKNQLTLPAGISAVLHVAPGDDLRFEVQEDGSVLIAPPSVRERLAPLAGRRRQGLGKGFDEIDAEIRSLRGPRDE